MRVEHVPFGPFVNASEERAHDQLVRALRAEPGDARFVLLTNVVHAVTGGGQPDEIDIVIVGSSGVHVVEVKHWDRAYVRSRRHVVEDEADTAFSEWQGDGLTVRVDYGLFVDPLKSSQRQGGAEVVSETIDGLPATRVSYAQADGTRFTALHQGCSPAGRLGRARAPEGF